MSLFKAAVTGFSAAGAHVANKYLDQQLQQQRAEFLAGLQRRTAGEIREDDFKFRTDPGRVQATRDIAAGDVAAKADATRAAEKAGWNDPEYQAGRDAQTEKETTSEVRRQSLMAEARAKAEARFRPRTPSSDDPFAKLPPAVRLAYGGLTKQAEQINAAIVKSQADGMWDPDKNPSQKALEVRLMALQDSANDLLRQHMPGGGDDGIRKMIGGDSEKADPRAGMRGDGGQGTPGKPTQPSEGKPAAPSLLQRARDVVQPVANALAPVANALAPSADAHAQKALAIGDKGAMRELLSQTNTAKPLSPAMRARLEAALSA